MNLQSKIKRVIKKQHLHKPKTTTNQHMQDFAIEKDLQGKDLFELNQDTIRLLSADLTIFNDYAFRYYLPQFIYFCNISSEFIMEDMFIQAFFRSNLLNETTERFLQFRACEKEIILEFLEKIYYQIESIMKTKSYKSLEIWEQEEVFIPFKNYKTEIKNAIKLWQDIKNE